MNNKLFYLDNEERSRILNLHENRSKSQYLSVLNNSMGTLSESIDKTYFWGVSPDEKIFFTNKNLYVNEGDELKKLEYDLDSLPYILETARKKCDKMLKEGKMALNNYLSVPKKFLTTLMENWDINKGVRQEINEHWDNKFKDSIKLLTENRKLIFENGLNYQLWEEVNLVANQLITEWNLWGGIKSMANTAWQGVKKVGSAIGSAAQAAWKGLSKAAGSLLSWVLKQGILPALRWIRRNLNTYIGMIIEIIASMFPSVVVVKAIWCMIVILDIYEILYDDYDPKDPDREQAPFIYLLTDLLSLFTTGSVGAGSKIIFKTAAKEAIQKGAISSQAKGFLKTIMGSLPKLSSILKYAQDILVKLFGQSVGGFLGKIFSGLDTVVKKLSNWVKKTFFDPIGATAKEIVQSPGQAALKIGVGAGVGIGFAEFMKEKSFKKGSKDPKIKEAKESLVNLSGIPDAEGGYIGLFKGKVDDNFDQPMEDSLKKLQTRFKLPVNGVLTPDIALALGIDFGPTTLEKILGKETYKNFGERVMTVNSWLKKNLTLKSNTSTSG